MTRSQFLLIVGACYIAPHIAQSWALAVGITATLMAIVLGATGRA